jgi:pyruvate-ferredoxin/flavodoxin oxidoreductase
LIIAYAHCIAHGYDMRKGLNQQKLAVQSGYWPLYRFNPDLTAEGKNPLIVDSKDPTIPLEQYAYNDTRYSMLLQSDEARAEKLMGEAKHDTKQSLELYRQLAALHRPADPVSG